MEKGETILMQLHEERYCPYCGKIKSTGSFIPDYRLKGNYLPCCKNCTDNFYKRFVKDMGEVGAIWVDCMVNNIPLLQSIWNECVKQIVGADVKSPFAIYYKALKEHYGVYEGVWQSDCWYGNFVGKTADLEIETFTEEELIQLIKDWGKFVDENGEIDYDAYDFLVSRYDEYVEGVVGLTNAMSMQFRNLCKAEWQKIKADESGDIAEIDRAQKLVDRLLSALKLDDFAVDKSDTDRFIDKIIWRIEETEPAELEDETKYVDIEGHEKIYESLMRSMRNLIANSREYPEIPQEEL